MWLNKNVIFVLFVLFHLAHASIQILIRDMFTPLYDGVEYDVFSRLRPSVMEDTDEPTEEGNAKMQAAVDKFKNKIKKTTDGTTSLISDEVDIDSLDSKKFVIDVHFHVIKNKQGGGDIPDEQIEKQIDVLNENFSGQFSHFSEDCHGNDVSSIDTNIQFNLVNINHVEQQGWYNLAATYEDVELCMKESLREGDCSTLNVYTLNARMAGLYGKSKFPWLCSDNLYMDGVILDYGTITDQIFQGERQMGKTLVHEVGHWLGLKHTFQGLSCDGDGDLVNDTPIQREKTEGCPTKQDTCPNSAGVDMVHNHMDYSDDCCRYQFTSEQKIVMMAAADSFREGNGTEVEYVLSKSSNELH